jgi:hypothetical protein
MIFWMVALAAAYASVYSLGKQPDSHVHPWVACEAERTAVSDGFDGTAEFSELYWLGSKHVSE